MALTDAERAKRYRDRRKRKKRVIEVVLDESDLNDLFDLYPFLRDQLKNRNVQELLGNLVFAGAVMRHALWGRQVDRTDLEV